MGKVVLQLPILTPYFMRKPPALLNDPPIIDVTRIIGLVVIMIVTGLWTILILHLAAGRRTVTRTEVTNPHPLIYGTILGLISAAVMIARNRSAGLLSLTR